MDIKIPKKWFQPSKWFNHGTDFHIDNKNTKKLIKRLKSRYGSTTLTPDLPIENLSNMIIGIVTLGIVFMVGSSILSTMKETIETDASYNATSEIASSVLNSMSILTPMLLIIMMLGTGVLLWIQRVSVAMFFVALFSLSLFLTILGAPAGLVFMMSVLMCAFYAWWYFTIDDDV
jgi:hypothetical protein